MYDQAVVRTGIKFGFFGALAGFAVILILFYAGVNPYGQLSWWAFLPVPIAVFWGINNYKRQYDAELGFLKALIIGLTAAFFLAMVSAALLFVFGLITGNELIQQHIAEMKILFGKTSAEALKAKILTQEAINKTYQEIENTTLADLTFDDFIKKFFVGLISAFVAAIYFRR